MAHISSTRTLHMVVKVMKGTQDFRETTKSFVQCRNEVFVYDKVIPYFKRFISDRHSSIDANQWSPKIYHLFYGGIPDLSDIDECILVMENISLSGFKNGPRLEMDMEHLNVMLLTIAEYHAVQYAMRIVKDPMLEVLKRGLTTLRWKEPAGSIPNLFEVLYPPAFDRMFDYMDRHPEIYPNEEIKKDIDLMRQKYGKDPVALLELFREDDEKFSLILHGDYNRNNVLFKYSDEDPETPIALRMIDFQEVRYASPAIDLFFFFYMSTSAAFREKHWDELICIYQTAVWNHLKEMLKCDDSDPRLQDYSLENFSKHFSRFAFYGTMVTIQFLPWMDADPLELEPLSAEFTRDMKSEKCKQLLLSVGGDASNKKVAEAVIHAASQGYLSFIKHL